MDYNQITNKLIRLFKMSPSKVIKKINNKVKTIVYDNVAEKKDLKSDMHIICNHKISYSYIDTTKLAVSKINLDTANYLCDMYLQHYFDLLGSGFIKVDYNINPLGVEGIKYYMSPKITDFDHQGKWLNKVLLDPHMCFAKNIWENVSLSYTPIDWQMDFKSGFRFSQKTWYKRQPVGKFRGVDIKVPWEISRMQHLTQLAIFSIIFTDKRDEITMEFKNQIYDFIASNPFRMGVNWACTMDVGIRAANMLLTYDILKGNDKNNILDQEFDDVFANFIYEQGEFIIHNLEWVDGDNNNHYLSDIAALLFISVYLENNDIINSWLVFSIQEIINCMERQFFDDGGNFEASTSYHRLSGELFTYSTALIYGILKNDKAKALKRYNPKLVNRLLNNESQKFNLNENVFFPNNYIDKLFKCGCFTMDIMKQNMNIPQVGDNDSGRFFKFSPVGHLISLDEAEKKYSNLNGITQINNINNMYFDEDILNHSTFISSVSGLFNYEGFSSFQVAYPLENSIIESLSIGFKLKREYKENKITSFHMDTPKLKYKKTIEIKFDEYTNISINTEDIKLIAYPDFGIYIFKGSLFYLSIFCGSTGKRGVKGHSHNDKLSFELNLSSMDIFVDPGTYIYTPLPQTRNEFRSVKAHNVPIVKDQEQNKFLDVFTLKDETTCHIVAYDNKSMKLYLTYRDIKIIREFIIMENSLIINDSCNKDFNLKLTTFKKGCDKSSANAWNVCETLKEGSIYSNGYGKLLNKGYTPVI